MYHFCLPHPLKLVSLVQLIDITKTAYQIKIYSGNTGSPTHQPATQSSGDALYVSDHWNVPCSA